MFRHLFSFDCLFISTERLVKPLNVTAVYCKSRTLQCTICDKYKKTLVQSNTRTNEDLHLKAVTLREGATQYKGTSLTQAFTYKCMTSEMCLTLPTTHFLFLSVKFSMSTYTSPASQNHGQPVCLGISNSNLYIACSESDGASPALLLKVRAPQTHSPSTKRLPHYKTRI